MQRIKVGYNDYGLKTFNEAIESKKNAFNNVYHHLRTKGLRVKKKALYEDVYKEWKRAFYDLHNDELTKKLSFERALDLFEFDVRLLHGNIETFESIEHDFDPITLKHSPPDFGIYIETEEQIQRYNDTIQFIEAVDKMKAHTNVWYGNIIQAVTGAVAPDHENQSLKPNLFFLLK